MYYPGSNYKASERIRQKRKDDADARHAAWLARLDDDSLTIVYTTCLTHRTGRVVIKGTDFGPFVDNDEKEW